MLLRRLLPLLVLFCLTITSLGAEIKRERREATLGALVGGLASPFINFKRGVLNLLGGSKAQKKPAKQAPKPSYGAPAPSYHAPAPSYSPPVPSYDPPAPSYSAPAPAYEAPAAPAYEPPAPKPDIQILPAPDLSQYAPPAAPAVDTYGSPAAAPAVDTYGSPAAAPAYEAPAAAPAVDTYGSPAAAPAYEAPAAAPAVDSYGSPAAAPAYEAPSASPAVDSYGSPVLPNYVVEQDEPEAPAQPPVYEPEAPAPPPVYEPEAPAPPPVYEPATYEPAPVDIPLKSVQPAPADPAPAVNAEYTVDLTKDEEPTVSDIVDVKSAVELRTTEDAPEAREPKAFRGDQPTSNELQTVDEKPIVIDLTNSFADIAVTTETVETAEVETEKPVATKIITFEAVESIPAISGPVQSSDEVISFSPRQETAVKNIDFTAVQNEAQKDTFTAAPEAVTEAVAETVTPIVANEELRSVVVELDSVPVEIAEIEEVDANEVEVIDLRTDKKSSGLTIIDHDEDHPEVIVVVDETTTTAVPITTQTKEVLDTEEVVSVDAVEDEIIKESDTDFSLVNTVVTTAVPAEIVSAKEPELRRVTFQILSDEEAENVNPEVAFTIVDPADAGKNTFDTFEIVETTTNSDSEQVDLINTSIGEVPAAIGSDPVFQEIVKTSEDTENVKRGYNAYDPRHSQVYAHKYNDKYSNWYYFRKGY